jgi:hypothetical protein
VDELASARVYAHVGYGPVPPCLLEEDQVAGAEVSPGDVLFQYVPLSDRVLGQLLAEFLEDELREAGAVF